MYILQERIVVNENLGDIFKHLTIVNFNYDRCVEHFLFHAIQAWSLKGEAQVIELMNSLNIYHPYGTVGALPWQSREGIQFGEEADEFSLGKCSSGIRTFNEEVEDKAKLIERAQASAIVRPRLDPAPRRIVVDHRAAKQNDVSHASSALPWVTLPCVRTRRAYASSLISMKPARSA